MLGVYIVLAVLVLAAACVIVKFGDILGVCIVLASLILAAAYVIVKFGGFLIGGIAHYFSYMGDMLGSHAESAAIIGMCIVGIILCIFGIRLLASLKHFNGLD